MSFLFSIEFITLIAASNACTSGCGTHDSSWLRPIVSAALAFIFLIIWNWWKSPPEAIAFDSDDPEKLAAEQEARDTLPIFWKAFDNPAEDETDFALKFNLYPEGNAEFIWAGSLKREKGEIYGLLLNLPLELEYYPDEYVKIDPNLIVDWTYFKGNVAQGHFITKLMFKHMPKRFLKQTKRELGWV
jgi:uncharacterized protein YegJ (DUF2314 family)